MRYLGVSLALVGSSCLFAGCAGPMAKLTYKTASADLNGYKFVIPRTAVNVAIAVPAAAKDDKKPAGGQAADDQPRMSLTPVPRAYGTDNKLLTVFTVVDDSGGGFGLTPTTVTSVTYLDTYIVSSLGSQVTDNRKEAIDAAFGVLGGLAKAGVIGFQSAAKEDCNALPASFVLDDFEQDREGFLPASKCWGYAVSVVHEEDGPDVARVAPAPADSQPGGGKDRDKTSLPLGQSVPWFPYPACREVKIKVFQCDPNTSTRCAERNDGKNFIGALNVSTGKYFRTAALPVKGKISLHADYCVADVTNDSSGLASNYSLLKQAITDYQALTQAGKTAK